MKRYWRQFGLRKAIIAIVIICLSGLAVWYLAGAATTTDHKSTSTNQSNKSTEPTKTDDIALILKNQSTNKPIANKAVEFRSDNGIRCITSPCPSNNQSLHLVTNQDGVILVPKAYFQENNYVEATSFAPRPIKLNDGQSSLTVSLSPSN